MTEDGETEVSWMPCDNSFFSCIWCSRYAIVVINMVPRLFIFIEVICHLLGRFPDTVLSSIVVLWICDCLEQNIGSFLLRVWMLSYQFFLVAIFSTICTCVGEKPFELHIVCIPFHVTVECWLCWCFHRFRDVLVEFVSCFFGFVHFQEPYKNLVHFFLANITYSF